MHTSPAQYVEVEEIEKNTHADMVINMESFRNVQDFDKTRDVRIIRREENRQDKLESVSSGYTLITRTEYRKGGGVTATGNNRTCLPDSCWVILLKLKPFLKGKITLKAVRQTFVLPNNEDPDMLMVEIFFDWFGIDITYQNMTGSPKNLLAAKDGVFLVGLKIGVPGDGNHFDNHALVYDAHLKQLYDNNRSIQIPQIEKKDLFNNRTAIRVFKHYFDKSTSLRIADVYKVELQTNSNTQHPYIL